MPGVENTKYEIKGTSLFKKQLKKAVKQGKDIKKLIENLNKLSNGDKLDKKHHNHNLIKNKQYKDCFECHIEPDWLLVYKYNNNELILFLISTGSHSELFNK